MTEPELHLVPDFSGGNGAAKIVLGAVLIVAAVASWQFELIGATAAFALGSFGASLALGGVLELLSPAPVTATPDNGPGPSQYLGAPKNTVSGTTRIPVAFGRYKLYGHYISFNIQGDLMPASGASLGDADARRAQNAWVQFWLPGAT